MIRALATADFAAWNRLWLAYLRFYRADVSGEVTEATFARLCGGTGGMTGLVAVGDDDDGALTGLAHLVFHPSTWSIEPHCYLEDLFVDPAARGSETARSLLEAVFAEAQRRGADRMYWETQEFNGAARSLYDQVAHRTSFIIYER
jgi:GNAT superfamily N-acetyltransferase